MVGIFSSLAMIITKNSKGKLISIRSSWIFSVCLYALKLVMNLSMPFAYQKTAVCKCKLVILVYIFFVYKELRFPVFHVYIFFIILFLYRLQSNSSAKFNHYQLTHSFTCFFIALFYLFY